MDREKILATLRSGEIKYVDLKALDLRGKLHHVTLPVSYFEDIIEEGVGFDGSSYGYVKIESSDLVLKPILETAFMDPFHEEPTMSFLCSIHKADKGRTRYPMDPRFVLEKSLEVLKKTQMGDDLYWGPEYEFYIFHNAEFYQEPFSSGFHLSSEKGEYYNGYHRELPEDEFLDFRDSAVTLLEKAGIRVKYHHHEVGQAGQQEIETVFTPTLETADNAIKIKYLLKGLAARKGLSLTFMPKPIYNQAGTGWHLHQMVLKDGKNVFYSQDGYANLSTRALHYIGGLLYHAKSLAAFTNASTNSYKRLRGGFEAPSSISFGRGNRGSAIRIPGYIKDPARTRIEFRTPDFTGNPYLILSSIIMAGLDGVIRGLDPVEMGYGPAEEGRAILREEMPGSLEQALKELEDDNDYLLRDGVFSEALISKWISLKREEINFVYGRPTPGEFILYF